MSAIHTPCTADVCHPAVISKSSHTMATVNAMPDLATMASIINTVLRGQVGSEIARGAEPIGLPAGPKSKSLREMDHSDTAVTRA
jgi:hypothetical protein